MKFVGYFIFLWVAVVACPGGVVRAAGAAGYAHFEGRQTHPVAMTPDKTRLLAVNTPDGRLSVFDISDGSLATPTLWAEIQVGLEPVSVRARTDNEVWVVNEASDTVSVIHLDRLSTVATLRCPDEPSDVVFAQGKAFVSCARNHAIRVFDVRSHAELSVIDLQGHYPRALVTDGQEERVYAAFQFSGNNTTILKASAAPAQPAPLNTNLPPPPKVALIVPASDSRIPYRVLDHDVAEISVSELRVERYHSGVGTILFDLAVHPQRHELWIANTEAKNLTRFEPNLKGNIADHRLTRIRLGDGDSVPFDLNRDIDPSVLPNPTAVAVALAQPTALVFTADGRQVWTAAFASGERSLRNGRRRCGDIRLNSGPCR